MRLAEQSIFLALRNWEDSERKIQVAYKAVEELKTIFMRSDKKYNANASGKEAKQKAREERVA